MSILVGVGLVVLVAADLGLTILHPSVHGPLSHRAERLGWLGVRGLTRIGGSDRLLSFGGPVAMGFDLLAWVIGLWLGFALIYAPFTDTFSYSSPEPFGEPGFIDALYLSGQSLTTVGFGDVVAGSDALRMVTILESASGFAVITAALAYIVSVYPRVSLARTTASRITDLGAETEVGAVRFIFTGGRAEVARLHGDLIEIHQDLRRFPVLYYFHARVPGESIAALLRSAALVCAYLRWGLRREAVSFAALYGPALERTLERLIEAYAWEFKSSRLDESGGESLDEREAQTRFHRMQEAVRSIAPEAVCLDTSPPPDLARFLARVDRFLRQFGRAHRYDSGPPLFTQL